MHMFLLALALVIVFHEGSYALGFNEGFFDRRKDGDLGDHINAGQAANSGQNMEDNLMC